MKVLLPVDHCLIHAPCCDKWVSNSQTVIYSRLLNFTVIRVWFMLSNFPRVLRPSHRAFQYWTDLKPLFCASPVCASKLDWLQPFNSNGEKEKHRERERWVGFEWFFASGNWPGIWLTFAAQPAVQTITRIKRFLAGPVLLVTDPAITNQG